MRITETQLRRIIRQEVSRSALSEAANPPPPPQTGPKVKGSPVEQAVEKRLDAFPSINSVLKNISNVTDLRALIQNILDKVGESGKIDQREMMSALTKTVSASRKAAVEKSNQARAAKKQAQAAANAEKPDQTSESDKNK
jgi:hypothetical protein